MNAIQEDIYDHRQHMRIWFNFGYVTTWTWSMIGKRHQALEYDSITSFDFVCLEYSIDDYMGYQSYLIQLIEIFF